MKVAILGAGHVGTVIARLTAEAGYEAAVATSGDPEDIQLTLQILAPGATPFWLADAVAGAGIVVMAIPLHRFHELDPALLAGRVVVDMMNYWPEVNGRQPEYEGATSSSERVAASLPGARVVKTINHLGYHQLDEEARPAGDPQRLALGVAGDDPAATEVVSEFVERIGFDAVPVGTLSAGRVLEPDGPVFGRPLSREEFERSLARRAA